VLCVVEEFKDVVVIEKICEFCGFYYVFGGVISLIDGVGFDDLCICELMMCLVDGVVIEVIIVIDLNFEGEVMVMYFVCLLCFMGLCIICFVLGLLVGGDFEYVDEIMLG